MAGDNVVQVPPDSTGKNIATYEKTEGGKTVQVQKVMLAGRSPDDDIVSMTAAPTGSESALPVRNIPSGTQAVSAAALPLPAGAATDAALAAVLGTAADAAVLGDTAGTQSAKSRGLNYELDQVRREIRNTNKMLFLILCALQSNGLAKPGLPL